MNQDSIQDSTRYIVSELHHGNIMPGKRSEMQRDVYLLTNADIRGGVYSNELSVKGINIRVENSVYSRKSVIIEKADDVAVNGRVLFNSVVIAEDSLTAKGDIKKRFNSDIYTGKINLENSFVLGNIFAKSATIKNSIILGGVYCDDHLNLSDSLIGTFKVGKVALGKNIYLLSPSAFCYTKFDIRFPLKSLLFLDLQEINNKSGESGIIELDNDDIFRLDMDFLSKPEEIEDNWEMLSGSKREVDNGHVTVEESASYCVSVSERILDTNLLIDNFRKNKDFLLHLSLNSHLSDEDKKLWFSKTIEELEDYLWKILEENKELPHAKFKFGLEEIRKRFGFEKSKL